MKGTLKIMALLFIISLASCKKPLDYYNKAVSSGNMAVSLQEMESRIERIQEGFEPEPIDLVNRINMRLGYHENYLEELREFLGNDATDPMINSAIDYLQFDITSVKNPETVKLLKAIDQKLTPVELDSIIEQFENHLDNIYDTKNELWDVYDKELTKYAKANDIKESFYGPNVQPVESEDE